MIKCPYCNASYYREDSSYCTAVYYPPIWKDGVNINPNRNVTTTRCHCIACDKDFVVKKCLGEETVLKEGEHA